MPEREDSLHVADTDQLTVSCPHCGSKNDYDAVQQQGVCDTCREEITVELSDPDVVCLCGSTRFKEEYEREKKRLTFAGNIVVSVAFYGHSDDVVFTDGEKNMLDELHKRKIDLADRVHVINVDGYIGDSTRDEIRYAETTGTPVTYVEELENC